MTKQTDPRDRIYARNLKNERRACARRFNLARRIIIAAAKKNDAALDVNHDAESLCYAADPISTAQKFNDYDRNGRNSSDLDLIVGELVELADDVIAVDESARETLKTAVDEIKGFDVWYGALCRRGWIPSSEIENALDD